MTDYLTLYVPIRSFPSQEQLAPLCPDAELQVDTDSGRAVISWTSLRVELNRMPDEQMAEHLTGFIGFVRQHGGSEALATRILHTLSVLGAVIEPEFDEDGRAMGFLSRLNGAAGGLGFLQGEVFSPEGEPLLMAEGSGLRAPDAERVAQRALILLSLSMRGLLEQDAGKPDQPEAEKLRKEVVAWLRQSPGLVKECEKDELALLEAPLGTPDRQSIINAVWRAEGAQVLLWALNARPLPAHDAQEHPYQVAKECGVLAPSLAPALASPRLRSAEEIECMRRKLLGIHWRLREYRVRPGLKDFAAFAQKNWFGGFSLEGIALAGGDLAVDTKPLAKGDPDKIGLVSSIANERHQAANWLIGVHPVYSWVGTPT